MNIDMETCEKLAIAIMEENTLVDDRCSPYNEDWVRLYPSDSKFVAMLADDIKQFFTEN